MPRVSSSTTTSIKSAQQNLRRFLQKLDTVPKEVLIEETARINAEIYLETPVKTTKLRANSKAVFKSTKGIFRITATASALNSTGKYDYAKIQHDSLGYQHPNGGKANFIRDPFRRGVARIKERLREEVKYGR